MSKANVDSELYAMLDPTKIQRFMPRITFGLEPEVIESYIPEPLKENYGFFDWADLDVSHSYKIFFNEEVNCILQYKCNNLRR